MKIIFLDWDGVLCTQEGYLKGPLRENTDGRYVPPFQPECVEQLARVIAETGAKIVLSTAWRSAGAVRCGEDLRAVDCHVELIGCTPWIKCAPRRDEIRAWITAAVSADLDIEGWVVLDDDGDAARQPGSTYRFVQCDMEHGLTVDRANEAIAILNGERYYARDPRSLGPSSAENAAG